ncbi:polysaccharide pyruvyl transferase family protein [Georgenia alba]|uniref:Polysaccharide pyruvyl transferase family protein n=1 Tax=Georgenia alba TaxID=2233858 RepID=A0ABW2Q7P5_9MICO
MTGEPWTDPRRADVFAMMTGDYPNIGDALIRERVFAWVRDLTDDADVYVGSAPSQWMERLGVRPFDRVYGTRQIGRWFAALLRARRPVLVVEPGELDLGPGVLLRQIAYLAFAVVTRAKGGVVVLPPRAVARGASGASAAVHRLMCTVAQLVWWRNASSVRAIGSGELAPDVAFSEPVYWGGVDEPRTALVVSMRGPRAWPGEQWVEAVRTFAHGAGLEVVCVAQVRQDEERAAELARALRGTHLAWGETSDVEHEQILRDLYRRAALTVSDRLHVLILAALGGAVPVEMAPDPAPKVAEHFATIGYRDLTCDARSATADRMRAHLAVSLARTGEIRQAVLAAQRALGEVERAVLAAAAVPGVAARPAPRPPAIR